MSQPSSLDRPAVDRVAVITGPLCPDRDYAVLDLGIPVAGAPMCVLCRKPAALVLDAGPACRRCLNEPLDVRVHPGSPA